MEQTYKNLIFTDHALNRMRMRTISQEAIWQTVHRPDRSKPEEKPNTTRFIRTVNDRTYHVVGTYLSEQDKTLVISTWVRGEEDQVPVGWQLLTLPFKLLWRLITWVTEKIKAN